MDKKNQITEHAKNGTSSRCNIIRSRFSTFAPIIISLISLFVSIQQCSYNGEQINLQNQQISLQKKEFDEFKEQYIKDNEPYIFPIKEKVLDFGKITAVDIYFENKKKGLARTVIVEYTSKAFPNGHANDGPFTLGDNEKRKIRRIQLNEALSPHDKLMKITINYFDNGFNKYECKYEGSLLDGELKGTCRLQQRYQK